MGGKPSLPGAACSALGGSGGAPRVVLLGRGSSFPLPPRKARDTHEFYNPTLYYPKRLVSPADSRLPTPKGLPSTRRCSGRGRGEDLLFLAERE